MATTILAVGAVATGAFAYFAFRAQREQLRRSVKDQQNQQQAELLSVQSRQLELQRAQLEDQRKLNATHDEFLELQAEAIRESLKQREREAETRRRSQAARVTPGSRARIRPAPGPWAACIRNASDLPIFDVRTVFHAIHRNPARGGWDPVDQGGPPPDETICVFPPQTDRSVAVPEKVQAMFGEVTDRTYVVSIEFIDAAGESLGTRCARRTQPTVIEVRAA